MPENTGAQWAPPSVLHDPLVRRLLVDRATWTRALRGRIPKIHDRAVAMALATYGNKDGSSNYPGIARLADDLFLSQPTVKRALAWLAEHGWISRTERGNRRNGHADVFHLAIPAPVAAGLGLWEDAKNGAQWMERPVDEPKRPGVRERPAPERQGRQGSPSAPIRDPEDGLGVCKDPIRDLSSDLPPEPVDQSLLNHSALPARPAATAARETDIEAAEQIVRAVQARTGKTVTNDGHWQIDALLAEGAHPRIVVAAVAAAEQQRTTA